MKLSYYPNYAFTHYICKILTLSSHICLVT